jgi:hypothetical protein
MSERKKRKLPDDYLYQAFDLLSKSYSIKEIAVELGISYAHLLRIFSKLYQEYDVKNLHGLYAIKDKVLKDKYSS